MKNAIFLMLLSIGLFSFHNAKAQVYVKKGDLKALLSDQSTIGVRFTYNNMSVGKFGSEENYVLQKVNRYDNMKLGRGKIWHKAWINDRFCHFQPEFLHWLTKRTAKTQLQFLDNTDETKYTMVVNTDYVDLGFNALIIRKRAQIHTTIKIVETATNKEVAVLKVAAQSPRFIYSYDEIFSKIRVGQAYKEAGKKIGKYLARLL